MKKGIDVSKHQGSIDWEKVKASGQAEFAMLRCGYRGYEKGSLVEDQRWKDNIAGVMSTGIPYGVYFFSAAISEQEAVEEAEWVIEKLNGKQLDYPVAFDYEYIDRKTDSDNVAIRTYGITKSQRTTFAIAFCNRIKEAGYMPMMYASQSGYKTNWETDRIAAEGIPLWCARYGTNDGTMQQDYAPVIGYEYSIWQYTSKGIIDGISGAVDLNICYAEYPVISDKPEESKYKAGEVYTLDADLKVRTGPGTSYAQKKTVQLTADAKKNAKSKELAVLKKGTIVTCKEVIISENEVWMKIPSGYICVEQAGEIYIK